jgi:hypothetical protein
MIVALGLAATPALAAPNCSGEACDALTVSADGCAWQNSSAKAVRFLLLAGSETLVSTVLPPGSTFREGEKRACVTSDPGSTRYEASYAALRQMPDAPDFTLKKTPQAAAAPTPPKPALPRMKPEQVASTEPVALPAAAPAPAAPAAPATVAVATVIPKPRAKPDMPALAPAIPVPATGKSAEATQMIAAPTPEQVAAGANPCGDACSEILFTRLDDCIWVQSQNPRPILFQATVGGRMIVLSLEGANAAKAQSSTKPPEGAASYHTRLHDPFVSTSDGIPVYRARLGEKGTCAADRNQISQFVAVYKK